MISIIICSRSQQFLSEVKNSIATTIGVPYEIIAIDNSQGAYGICKAYNIGAARSQYDILCFAHEDLKFHTQNWGVILLRILQDESIGVIGVAGTTYMPDVPAPWWVAGEAYNRMNVVHTTKTLDQALYNINPHQETLADVVALDGLWITTRKHLWAANPFDEKTFYEFHCYDLDFCLGLLGKTRLCVTYEINIEHFSTGSVNTSLIRNIIKLYKKRSAMLPAAIKNYSKEEKAILRSKSLEYLLDIMQDNAYSQSVFSRYLLEWLINSPINRNNFWKFRFYIGIVK